METVRGREKVQEHLLIISGKLSQFHILYDGGQSLYGGDGEGEEKKKVWSKLSFKPKTTTRRAKGNLKGTVKVNALLRRNLQTSCT